MKSHLVLLLTFGLISAHVSAKEVTIYYTSNGVGEIEPCGCVQGQLGGLDRRANFLKDVDFKTQANFLVDSGDLFFKSKFIDGFIRDQLMLKADLITRFYQRFLPDGMITGEIDLSEGLKFLKAKPRANFPFLGLNLVEKQIPVFRTHMLIEKAGIKLAITGWLSKGLFEGVKSALPGIEWKDATSELRALIGDMKAKADLTVLIYHGQKNEEFDELIGSLTGFTLVIAGHDSDALSIPRQLKNGSMVVEADGRGQYVGRIRLSIKDLSKAFVNQGEIDRLKEDLEFLKEEEKNLSSADGAGDSAVRNIHEKIRGIESRLSSYPKARENQFWNDLISMSDSVGSEDNFRKLIEDYKEKIRKIEKKK